MYDGGSFYYFGCLVRNFQHNNKYVSHFNKTINMKGRGGIRHFSSSAVCWSSGGRRGGGPARTSHSAPGRPEPTVFQCQACRLTRGLVGTFHEKIISPFLLRSLYVLWRRTWHLQANLEAENIKTSLKGRKQVVFHSYWTAQATSSSVSLDF